MAPPRKNRIGVATRKGRNARFSVRYSPGAMNIQSCAATIGKVRNAPAQKATFR